MISDTKSRWKNLEEKLKDIYKERNLGNNIKEDLIYLRKAYLFIEKLWCEQFNKLPNMVPKVVMLSEAPLFGQKKNYFYNPDTAPSAFFWFDDAEAVAGDDFARDMTSECPKEKKKQFLIDAVTSNGLLILDLFPYALNKKNTALNYRDADKELYFRIFCDSIDDHLCKKLDLIKEKCNGSNPPLFLFRYKRLKDRLDYDVKSVLCSRNLLEKGTKIESIGGTNMSLNRKHLAEIFKGLR